MTDQKLAILWDMDGTIIDSTACHYSTWKVALEKYGFEIDRHVYQENFGRNNRALLPLLLGFTPKQDLFNKITTEKEALFRELAPQEASLVPGVEDWLVEAKNAQIPQAVASSASMRNISSLMTSFDLLVYFDFFLSGADLPAKPAPIVFLEAAKVLDRTPEQCLVIEDSQAGISAAKRAGMTCIAVATTHPKHELAMADMVVDDFTKPLMDILGVLGLL